jgi:NAD(P)-dependent dehydrogenase (short-subunit alcohol dehydrogenase family)
MGSLDGRVAIITGAGRGLGREYARYLAAEGAQVVVNDVGTTNEGDGSDGDPATEVVAEINAAGGTAVANTDDVADWEGAHRLVDHAVEVFGDLDILVNNAGILRDRSLVNMTEAEWDSVVAVHLKGHYAPTHWAGGYWRAQFKSGVERPRNLVHTTSTSGLFANPGQSNYGPAKSGIATLSQIAAKELARYGVVSNCIAPGARTRLTMASPGLDKIMAPREAGFDEWHPANIAPVVAYLSTSGCPFTGETFYVQGGMIRRIRSWEMAEMIEHGAGWNVEDLAEAMPGLLGAAPIVGPDEPDEIEP